MKFIGILLLLLILGGLGGVIAANNMKTATPLQGVTKLTTVATQHINSTQDIFNTHIPAPELTGITAWINPSKQFTLKSLQGKVVLVDFWTNQCINCIHTLPYITKWYDTYKDQGFLVVGVHTPELTYEHTLSSIQTAIQTYDIHYPVVQDNDYATWNAYNNQYWPAQYLIDKKGIIRRVYFGEGEYDKTELAIQALLKE